MLYVGNGEREFHEQNATPDGPLNAVPFEKLTPGSRGLEKILSRYR
jgi:hypothetical protein